MKIINKKKVRKNMSIIECFEGSILEKNFFVQFYKDLISIKVQINNIGLEIKKKGLEAGYIFNNEKNHGILDYDQFYNGNYGE